MKMRSLILAHAATAVAALTQSAMHAAPRGRCFTRQLRLNAAAGDDEDLAALDDAARAAQSSADAAAADDAAAPLPDDNPFWRAVAEANIIDGGGASFQRGRVVDAARADADAARERGVVDLVRAGELQWAQNLDRVAVFLPVAEDARARAVSVDVSMRALSITVDGAAVLDRAPLRHGVDADAYSWTLEDVATNFLVIELPKLDDAIVWASLLDGRSREEMEDELSMQFGREMDEDDPPG